MGRSIRLLIGSAAVSAIAAAVLATILASLSVMCPGLGRGAHPRRYLQSGFVCLRCSRRGCFVCFWLPRGRIT
jgi:hypothetical protein